MFESLVGLNVQDEEGYRRYREGMTPILQSYGGSFRYDFRVSEVLKSEATHPINRVFVIVFPDQEQQKSFFSDPKYLEVRRRHFEPSVNGIARIAEYSRS